MSLVKLAQDHLLRFNKSSSLETLNAIDATAGNGNDTLFLAKLVGDNGHVFSIDIQQNAIDATRDLLRSSKLENRVTLIHGGHEKLDVFVSEYALPKCNFIMFNLGYLPGGDKSIVTNTNTSIRAIQHSLNILHVGGLMSVLAYPGHNGGEIETDGLRTLFSGLPKQHFRLQKFTSQSPSPSTPELFILEKQSIT